MGTVAAPCLRQLPGARPATIAGRGEHSTEPGPLSVIAAGFGAGTPFRPPRQDTIHTVCRKAKGNVVSFCFKDPVIVLTTQSTCLLAH